MHTLGALLSLLALSSSHLVNALPALNVKDGTTISVEPGEHSISALHNLNHDKQQTAIITVNQKHNPNSLTLQQPIHTLSKDPFDFRQPPLHCTGSLNTKTHVLNVNIFISILFLGENFLKHASAALGNRVIVPFDSRVAAGSVEFYKRGDSGKQLWAKSKFVLFGKEYNYDTPVRNILEEFIPEIPLYQAHDIGLVHALDEQYFSYGIGPLAYNGTVDFNTFNINVDVFIADKDRTRTLVGHREEYIRPGVTVQFSEEGPAQGEIHFYLRDGAEVWAMWRYVLDGMTYSGGQRMLKAFRLLLHHQEEGYYHNMPELLKFDVSAGQLRYTGIVDPTTLYLSINLYLASSNAFLGQVDGNLKKELTCQIKPEGKTGVVRLYVQGSGMLSAITSFQLDGKPYKEDAEVFDFRQQAQSQQHTHTIDSAKSFDVKAWPLQYTGTLDTNTLTLSVDDYLETSYKSKTLLGHAERNLNDEVEFTFSEEGIAEGRVLFYLRHGSMWGAIFAKSIVILNGGVYSNDVPVLNIPWQDQVQQSHDKQHSISILGITSFDTIVGPIQYTGIFDTETHTLSIDVDVLDVPDNIHLGTEEGSLRHGGGVLVEFDKEGVATGKVLFYEKAGEVWAMARFTLYGKYHRSNVLVWEVPE